MVLKVTDLKKTFKQGDGTDLAVLNCINFELKKGEKIAVMGASGSGKTTFLHCATGLEYPTSGIVEFLGENITKYKEAELAKMRNSRLGFVFQFHYLLKDFSVVDNVAMPCLISGLPERESKEKAYDMLNMVGMSHRLDYNPRNLSGGELQRVAIARALVMNPELLVMDEPTGNLDEHMADQIIDEILKIPSKFSMSILMVTHNFAIANRFDKSYKLHNGSFE